MLRRIVIKSFSVISTGPGSGIPTIIDLSTPRRSTEQPATAAPQCGGGIHVVRSAHNPIVVPGGPAWRAAVTFNPGVLLDEADGRFYVYGRAAGSLRPFRTCI